MNNGVQDGSWICIIAGRDVYLDRRSTFNRFLLLALSLTVLFLNYSDQRLSYVLCI